MIWTISSIVLVIIILVLSTLRIMIVRGGRGVITQNPIAFVQEPDTSAQVIRLSNGDYKLCWTAPHSTKLFISTEPNRAKQEKLASLSGECSFFHRNPDPSHRYFYAIQHIGGSVTHTAERIWRLDGILNLRDIGGYQTKSGQTTRWGKIYRTAHLGNATDETLEILSRYGISLICDLRSNRELTENPDRVPNGATYLHTPIYKDDQLSGIFPKLLFDRAALGDQLGAGYIRMIDERAEVFASLIGRFADPANLPVMFHCTAGKDRAGLTAAMLLTLLGVPRATIIADYTLSNLASEKIFVDFMGKNGTNITRFGVPLEQLRPLFIADPKWLENSLDHIDNNYGGVDNYLLKNGGLAADKIDTLRKNLLL